MGRWTTGATTTAASQRLELGWLMKNGHVRKGQHTLGTLSWTDDSTIGFECNMKGEEPYLKLSYTITPNGYGEPVKMDYRVHLTSRPSNLGQGNVWYFICPVSGRNARILYRAYGSHYFKHRDAYSNRIYYECQRESKTYRAAERKNTTEFKLQKMLKEGQIRPTYRGKPTKRAIRHKKLIDDLIHYEGLWATQMMELFYK